MKLPVLLAVLLFTGIYSNAQTPVCQWARGFGVAGIGVGPGMATDAEGNVYATGIFTGATLTIGSTTLINGATNGAQNMFTTKYDSSGNVLWANSAGGGANEGTENVTASALGTDANGNAYVLGSYQTPIAIFGTDTLVTTNVNTFLVKYDTEGNTRWAINVGGTLNNATNMVVDASGNSYIVGAFTSGSIIGGSDTIPLAGFIEGFVIKYDSSGNSVWATGISGDENVFNDAVAIDDSGNVYVTGTYDGETAVAGNFTLLNTGVTGMFTVKYNASGQVAWAKGVSVSADIYPTAISSDSHGHVYLTGNTTADTLVFGADTAFTFSQAAPSNIFVAGYNTVSGSALWVRCTQNGNNISSTGISADGSGHVYVTGSFGSNSVQIGNTTLTNNNDTIDDFQALFIAGFDDAGNVNWVIGGLTGKDDVDGGGSIEADNKGHLYVAGSYGGPSVIFGPDTLPFTGNANTSGNGFAFISRYGINEISTGISNAVNTTNTIIVYPNPSGGRFCFKGIASGSTLQVYDLLGQLIYATTFSGDNESLNIVAQAKGVYLYRVTNENDAVQQGKIVVE